MATTTTEWTERAPTGPQPAGDVGGDIQAGEAYSRSFVKPAKDSGWCVVNANFYVAEEKGQRWIQQQTEYLLCADPDDPGGTEAWGNIRYDDVVTYGGPLAELTDQDAIEACKQFKIAWIEWNGEWFA